MEELTLNKFKLVGGHPALDFINTVSARFGASGPDDPDLHHFTREKITNYLDLVSWSTKAALLLREEAERLLEEAERNPADGKKVLNRAIKLRESAYRLVRAAVGKWTPN